MPYNQKTIVVTALSSDSIVNQAMQLGATYYMLKPVIPEYVIRKLDDIDQVKSSQIFENKVNGVDDFKYSLHKGLDEKISNLFLAIGIPAHIRGYQYLREGIKLAVEDPNYINGITKVLYPKIAEKFNSTPSKVERAIRHSIEVAWNRGKVDSINNIFGVKIYSNCYKPTNGEFIALVADKLLLEST